jgi:hypothetical protein
VWKAQRGRERPCDATVAFRCGAVTYDTLRTHLLCPVPFPECCCAGYASSTLSIHGTLSLSPEIPKTCWRQFRVAHRVLDVAVAEISLQGSGVVLLVDEPVIASAATEAARTSSRAISANTEATSGYPALPSQRLPHPP